MKVLSRRIIGTDDRCDMVIVDHAAHGYHCEVVSTAEDQFYVRDLGTNTGTFVKGNDKPKRVTGWTRIYPHQMLLIGKTLVPWDKLSPSQQ